MSRSFTTWSAAASLALLLGGACTNDPDADADSAGIGTESDTGAEEGDESIFCEREVLGAPVLRRMTRAELERSLRTVFPELGGEWEGVALGPDPVSERGFSNQAELLMVGNQTAKEILQTAEDVAEVLTRADVLAEVLPCSQSSADTACAQTLIEERGRALFHRSLTTGEVDQYVGLFNDISGQSDFETGLRWTLVSLIQSPNFVYRFELGVDDGTGRYELEPWEIATALAYTYTGTAPSEELLQRAESGELDDAQARITLASELLDAGHGEAIVEQLFAEWVRYGLASTKVKTGVEGYEGVRDDLVEETRLFIDKVVREEGGSMTDLLTSGETALNAELAQYYGWGSSTASGFSSQERPADYSVGLLAQGSILAGYSHTDSSSPTLRGLMIYEKLLCNPTLLPPPDVPSIDPPQPGEITTRERYEVAHAGDDFCASCHDNFDPLGFAFEHFDESGRYRADESGLAIDTAASVTLNSGETLAFDGLTELATGLSQAAQVHACTGDNIERFAFGGEVEGCRELELREALVGGELGILDYFVELAGAPGFVARTQPE